MMFVLMKFARAAAISSGPPSPGAGSVLVNISRGHYRQRPAGVNRGRWNTSSSVESPTSWRLDQRCRLVLAVARNQRASPPSTPLLAPDLELLLRVRRRIRDAAASADENARDGGEEKH